MLNTLDILVVDGIIRRRDDDEFLRTSNLSLRTGASGGYINTSGVGEAWIYKFRGLAEGLTLFSN